MFFLATKLWFFCDNCKFRAKVGMAIIWQNGKKCLILPNKTKELSQYS